MKCGLNTVDEIGKRPLRVDRNEFTAKRCFCDLRGHFASPLSFIAPFDIDTSRVVRVPIGQTRCTRDGDLHGHPLDQRPSTTTISRPQGVRPLAPVPESRCDKLQTSGCTLWAASVPAAVVLSRRKFRLFCVLNS